MSQEDICEVLKKYNKPLTRTQIAEELNENPNKVSKIIKVLLIHQEIKCIEISRLEAKTMLGDKAPYRRLKLYYL
jgi:hypothetical protein